MRTILIFFPTAKAETLNHAFRLAAQTVGRSQTALEGFHRRTKAHLGAPKVSTATAYELARMFYMLWTSGEPYRDPKANYYEQRCQQRVLDNLEEGFCSRL